MASITFGPGTDVEDSLQDVLDSIYFSGPVISADNDQFAPDEYWSIAGSGSAAATIIVEIAGNAGTNELYLFDKADPTKIVQLFTGDDSAGKKQLVTILADGSVALGLDVVAGDTGVDFAGNLFGFMLRTDEGDFYSDPALNGDGLDHLVTYRGNGETEIALPGQSAGTFTPNEYIFAFEDLPGVNGNPYPGDGDYNDFVFIAESIVPVAVVPEATTIVIWSALGTIGFLAYRRRQLA